MSKYGGLLVVNSWPLGLARKQISGYFVDISGRMGGSPAITGDWWRLLAVFVRIVGPHARVAQCKYGHKYMWQHDHVAT